VEKKKAKAYRIFSIFVTIILLLNFYSIFYQNFILPSSADNGNIPEAWHNTSQLSVSVVALRPQIVFYDFQYYNYSNGWESRLNQQIDINNSARYRFVVNITSYQGWDDIEYVNISAWHDHGDENSNYNDTEGGNLNMKFVYDNTSNDTGTFKMIWPREEITFTNYSETVVNNSFTSWADAESMNLTFEFIPNYQFRHAPGPKNGWDTTSPNGVCTNMSFLFNPWSWNFNITVTDWGENNSGIPKTGWVADEFGTYKYSEIFSAENPLIYGEPTNEYYSVNDEDGSGNVTIVTRSNGNYSLSSNLSDLIHISFPGYSISNESVSLRGGNRTTFDNFSKATSNHPVYLYGGGYDGMPNYQLAENNGTNKTTNNVEYRCFIPIGQEPGEYISTVYYHLRTN
jgi:hypothetical protein